MNNPRPTPLPPIRLEMPCSHWLTLSMIIFGVVDAQIHCGRRILDVREMLMLHQVGGRLNRYLMYTPTYSWHQGYVLLSACQVRVILKCIRWYEDSLVNQVGIIEKMLGETELVSRYETLTKLTRALQTAPQVNSDQHDR